jgi:hypothetical protein
VDGRDKPDKPGHDAESVSIIATVGINQFKSINKQLNNANAGSRSRRGPS